MALAAESLLRRSGVEFLTHRWRPLGSFDELLGRQGTYRVARTVAVEAAERLVLVVLRADDGLDHGKLARALGVDQDAIMLASSRQAADVLGVDPGFETILTEVDVGGLIDERVLRLSKVLVSSGRNDRLLELAPADLLAVSGADVADVAAE
jgi:Cys-tRNA(Pro)/Cys-tRNA(Cys) deacylase